MKITVLENDSRLGCDHFDNECILVLKAKRRIFRICDGLFIFGARNIQLGFNPRYYICDQHGWRTSYEDPEDAPELEQQVMSFAHAYLALVPALNP